MIAWDMLVWWYTEGWGQRLGMLKVRTGSLADYFSIDLLLRTLFAPFRQISAGTVDGPFDQKVRAFFDRAISRLIGACARLFLMVVGCVTITLGLLADGVILCVWALVPILPIVGLVLFLTGWLPWNQ